MAHLLVLPQAATGPQLQPCACVWQPLALYVLYLLPPLAALDMEYPSPHRGPSAVTALAEGLGRVVPVATACHLPWYAPEYPPAGVGHSLCSFSLGPSACRTPVRLPPTLAQPLSPCTSNQNVRSLPFHFFPFLQRKGKVAHLWYHLVPHHSRWAPLLPSPFHSRV